MDTHESEQEGYMIVRVTQPGREPFIGWMEVMATLHTMQAEWLGNQQQVEILETHIGPWKDAVPTERALLWRDHFGGERICAQ